MKIVIDAGHGGPDPGAVNNKLGLQEGILSLEIGQALSIYLKGRGHNVKNTRQTVEDTPVPSSKNRDLAARAQIANNFGADCFVSIHLNGHTSSQANGFEIYRYRTTADKLGEKIVNQVSKEFPTLRIRRNEFGGGVKIASFAVIRLTNMPAVLVECGFITNNEEARVLSDKNYQQRLATAIGVGIEQWYGS